MSEDKKQLNKYAVVMTAFGMIYGANAFINGLDYYGNNLDFYLIGNDVTRDFYEENIKDVDGLNINVNFVDQKDIAKKWSFFQKKRGGWKARFMRYKWAQKIKDKYDSILIVDADMICMNNIMEHLKRAKETGKIIQPDNPWGYSVERIDELGLKPVHGAASPPFHNMPLFIDVKEWSWLLEDMWKRGKKNGLGDMATLFRTEYANEVLDDIELLNNDLWVFTNWKKFKLERKIEDGKPYFYAGNDKINMVHRRWWDTGVCEKFAGDVKEEDNFEKGSHNIRLFWEEYKRLNTEHKIKVDFHFEKPTLKSKYL